ncbi:MAG: hypothetical protein M0Z77_08460 [Thermoplasmatales archaeon]|jgi:hypothetical protein|nr:ATP-binding protein [Candidatus Thermoplasmatota archaeon]MDA8055659.1 hypothetical protein [Thermoplasmatales archaeon]
MTIAENEISDKEMEEIVRELIADGMTERRAEEWSKTFKEWYADFRQGILKLDPLSYAEYWINETFFPAGYGTTVFARQGMGKTNLATFLMETGLILHKNWIFLVNIPFPKPIVSRLGDRVIQIRTAEEMMRNIILVLKRGLIPVLILDEFDSVFSSTMMSSRQGRSWQSFVWRQRHFSVRGPLMLYHDVKSIPPPVRNKQIGGEILWIKGWQDERYISNPDLPHYMQIRKTKIPFLSHGSIGFQIDLDFSDILNRVSGNQEEVIEQIEGILNERTSSTTDKRESQVKTLSGKGLSQKEISEVLHMSLRDVSRILKDHYQGDGNPFTNGNADGNAQEPEKYDTN